MFVSSRKFLPNTPTFDKVLHITGKTNPLHNTLSRGRYGRYSQSQKTNYYPFYKATMPYDQITGVRTKLFHPLGSSISCGSGILQQLHPQREMVYAQFRSQLQSGRTLVLSRNRFFPRRQFNQNVDHSHCKQSSGGNGRTIRRKAPLPVSFSTGSATQEKKTTAPEDGALIYLSRRRSSYCRQTTTSDICTNSPDTTNAGRNFNFGSGGIYPQPPSQFYTVSRNDQEQQKCQRRSRANRTTFRSVLFKKNDTNYGPASWRALNSCLQQLTQETLPAFLFPSPPVVPFVPERAVCQCGKQLVVQKTRRKIVLSMIGPFVAHETLLRCSSCSHIFTSDALQQMVPKWCNIGYDILVYVGRALFQRFRTIREVSSELYLRNVQISDSEISYLGYKFISYLAACHQNATPKIRQSMELSGGYILHLDATHDGNAPALMTGMDSLSEIVLGNVKIPSEHTDHIVPFLQKLQKNFGTPQACVHDMGKGICKAIAKVFPGTPDFICHFHFLRDIGKDFMEPAYSSLRSCLRKDKTSLRLHALAREMRQRLNGPDFESELLAKAFFSGELPENTDLLPLASAYSMTLWILQGKHSGDGYGFPFDRPLLVFAERLLEGQQYLSKPLDSFSDTDKIGKQSIVKLIRIVSEIINDTLFQQGVKELHWRCQVFDNLRKAMRIAPPNGKNGLNDDGTNEAISTIRAGVQQFRNKLDNNAKWSADRLCSKMAKQIDQWNEKLFADPIEVETPQGAVILYPQRTNNILEQFFRGVRQGQRRKTGSNTLRPMIQTMLADTPLVKNLDSDEYMKMLLNGKKNLEALFADLETSTTVHPADLSAEVDHLLPGFRKLITLSNLPKQVAYLLSKNKISTKSN